MLVAVDLSRLFLATRELRVKLDYAELFEFLRSLDGGEVRLIGFSLTSGENKRQQQFLNKLASLGMEIHPYDAKQYAPSFSECIAATIGEFLPQSADRVLVVSDDPALIPVFNLLHKYTDRLGLCFFGMTLGGQWAKKILRDHVHFVDLSDDDTLRRVTLREGEE